MLFEPGAVLAMNGVNLSDRVPEGFAVVWDLEVHQLMDDDVFNHGQGRHAQSVGEVEVVVTRTAPPAGARAGDPHLADLEAVLICIMLDQALGDLAGLLPVPGDENLFCTVLHRSGEEESTVQVEGWALAIRQTQGILLAQVPEGFSRREGLGLDWRVFLSQPGLGLCDPIRFPGDQGSNLRIGG